ncbi:hypothetical protein EIN_359520 [Entamoeba invadens IP1]|uniref:Uncharacterized protein n=1 Tax=Entamoeba invadens IP1 TaxID=370355 RepID=A0A0A1UDP5_ENTIV|nr:hypothetical protein EIN_359520 [Entamoeba invadens IP1]ELP90869.1 hypothetical protein EIN_359520 [Entamoeba invadens IP1]|eukprot:XP_004257640.1 hypothetical protein EIN_359520 [Entamoeba invadens IP1]
MFPSNFSFGDSFSQPSPTEQPNEFNFNGFDNSFNFSQQTPQQQSQPQEQLVQQPQNKTTEEKKIKKVFMPPPMTKKDSKIEKPVYQKPLPSTQNQLEQTTQPQLQQKTVETQRINVDKPMTQSTPINQTQNTPQKASITPQPKSASKYDLLIQIASETLTPQTPPQQQQSIPQISQPVQPTPPQQQTQQQNVQNNEAQHSQLLQNAPHPQQEDFSFDKPFAFESTPTPSDTQIGFDTSFAFKNDFGNDSFDFGGSPKKSPQLVDPHKNTINSPNEVTSEGPKVVSIQQSVEVKEIQEVPKEAVQEQTSEVHHEVAVTTQPEPIQQDLFGFEEDPKDAEWNTTMERNESLRSQLMEQENKTSALQSFDKLEEMKKENEDLEKKVKELTEENAKEELRLKEKEEELLQKKNQLLERLDELKKQKSELSQRRASLQTHMTENAVLEETLRSVEDGKLENIVKINSFEETIKTLLETESFKLGPFLDESLKMKEESFDMIENEFMEVPFIDI